MLRHIYCDSLGNIKGISILNNIKGVLHSVHACVINVA